MTLRAHEQAPDEVGSACSPAAFEERYRHDADPWRFATSPYELNRYDVTLRSLCRPRYRRAFEPGCSIGMLTSQLARRCDEVVATEIAPAAMARARARCAPFPNVRLELSDIGNTPPPGRFDLIVFSEIGYYFTHERLSAIARHLAAALEPGGELVAVHWLGTSEDHVLHGDDVHATLSAYLPLSWVKYTRHAGFRVDSWVSA